MISPVLQQHYDALLRAVEPLFGASPCYYLDRSWPSMGALDLILFQLRGKPTFTPEERILIKGAASLIALTANEVWSKYEVEIEAGEGERGIFLRAKGGPHLPDEQEFRVDIESALIESHQSPSSTLSVFTTFSRIVTPYDNFVSPISLGILLGSTLYGEGLWAEQPIDNFGDGLEPAIKQLGSIAADGYANRYPEEPIGQVAELYLNGAIFPPPMMSESLPSTLATQGMVNFLVEYQVPKGQAIRLAKNLVRLPDESLSNLGFILLCAYADLDSVPAELYAFRESHPRSPLYLRPAIIIALQGLGLGGDWIDDIEGDSEQTSRESSRLGEKRYLFEQAAGLLPWIRLPWSVLKRRHQDPRLQNLLHAARVFDLSECSYLTESLLEEQPGDIELRLQRLALNQVKGDFAKLETGAKQLLTEPGGDGVPDVHLYLGHAALGLGRSDEALERFTRARSLVSEIHHLCAEITVNQAWCHVVNGRFTQAKVLLDSVRPGSEYPLTLLLNRHGVARALEETESAESMLKELQSLAPSDRRVFSITSAYSVVTGR